MDPIKFTVTVLIVRLSLIPPALRPCADICCHHLLISPLCDPLLSVSICSQDSLSTGFSLFPLHIRRMWVFEGKKSALLLLMSFTPSLSFVCSSLLQLPVSNLFVQSFLSFIPSPCCFCCCGGRGEERRAGCLNCRAKKKRIGTALSLSLPASLWLRQCVPPSLPPSLPPSVITSKSQSPNCIFRANTHTQVRRDFKHAWILFFTNLLAISIQRGLVSAGKVRKGKNTQKICITGTIWKGVC